jgi:hypothetical protein
VQQHRTKSLARHGHREVTLQLAAPLPVPNLQDMLLKYFENAVARGTKFLPGQTVRFGWSALRLCERSDGTLGVEERALTAEPGWTESVDRALLDTWLQKEVCASVGLLEEMTFPKQDDTVMVADCALDGGSLLMIRLEADSLPQPFSGWTLTCAEEHDHGERHFVPLLAVAANQPGLVQFLALPHDTWLLISYVAPDDAQPDVLRIMPSIFRGDDELEPRPGSYIASMQD